MFKSLHPTTTENGFQFVRRVEMLRRQLGKTTKEALSTYLDRLPAPLYKEVELTRRIRGVGMLTWEQIVALANDAIAMCTEDITIDA